MVLLVNASQNLLCKSLKFNLLLKRYCYNMSSYDKWLDRQGLLKEDNEVPLINDPNYWPYASDEQDLNFTSGRGPYCYIGPSIWPFGVAVSATAIAQGFVCWVWGINGFFSDVAGLDLIALGFSGVFWGAICWWRDVWREGMNGIHSSFLERAIWDGFMFFIISETFFFFSFFWAFGHGSLAADINQGMLWPPSHIRTINPWKVPLACVGLLLVSGRWATCINRAVYALDRSMAIWAAFMSIFMGVVFLGIQGWEYWWASFTMMDGLYGSCFYIITGCHGFHVVVGVVFLIVVFFRLYWGHFNNNKHVVVQMCCWYWHFVDYIWVAVWLLIYAWGNNWPGFERLLIWEVFGPYVYLWQVFYNFCASCYNSVVSVVLGNCPHYVDLLSVGVYENVSRSQSVNDDRHYPYPEFVWLYGSKLGNLEKVAEKVNDHGGGYEELVGSFKFEDLQPERAALGWTR